MNEQLDQIVDMYGELKEYIASETEVEYLDELMKNFENDVYLGKLTNEQLVELLRDLHNRISLLKSNKTSIKDKQETPRMEKLISSLKSSLSIGKLKVFGESLIYKKLAKGAFVLGMMYLGAGMDRCVVQMENNRNMEEFNEILEEGNIDKAEQIDAVFSIGSIGSYLMSLIEPDEKKRIHRKMR